MSATRTAGLGSGGVVALVAAVASYTHMRELVATHGEPWLSWIEPLSVDGLMVVASLVVIVSRRTSGRAGLAWLALVVGVLVSLLANVAAAGPDLVSKLVAAWPPLAFATAFELVLRLVRGTDTSTPGDDLTARDDVIKLTTRTDKDGEPVPVPVAVEPVPDQPATEHLVDRQEPHQAPGGDLVSRAKRLVAAGEANGVPVGRGTLARELEIPEHQARQLLATLRNGAAR